MSDKEKNTDEDIDENSLEYAKHFKKRLRFDLGETVYLKSDKGKKCPMSIEKILVFDDESDYRVGWMTSQKTHEGYFFLDKLLMQ